MILKKYQFFFLFADELTQWQANYNSLPKNLIILLSFSVLSWNICIYIPWQYYRSDIPPGTIFSCETQASLDKCFRTWMYKEAFCLRSCGRCGDGCNDITPPGSTECDASLCETDEYIGTGVRSNMSDGEPRLRYCRKTCRRCSVTTTVWYHNVLDSSMICTVFHQMMDQDSWFKLGTLKSWISTFRTETVIRGSTTSLLPF